MKTVIAFLFLISVSYAQTITYDTIQVNTGWNLIGAVEDGPITNIISTSPPGIIVSSFFGYSGTYIAEDTLSRGKGYWVKVSEPGLIFTQIQLPSVNDPCNSVLTVYYGNKTYNTVAIGSQCWLRENLNVGTMISGASNAANNGVIEKYCYNDDSVNCLNYGGLYQWNEAMQYVTTQGTQGICPSGWHIPTLAEFQTLSAAVGGNSNELKAVGQGTGGGAGTNTSGFSALLAGYRYNGGGFYDFIYVAYVWNSTQLDATRAYAMFLGYYDISIYLDMGIKASGYSVRCLRD